MDSIKVTIYPGAITLDVQKLVPNMADGIMDTLSNQGWMILPLTNGGQALVNFGECGAVVVDGG